LAGDDVVGVELVAAGGGEGMLESEAASGDGGRVDVGEAGEVFRDDEQVEGHFVHFLEIDLEAAGGVAKVELEGEGLAYAG